MCASWINNRDADVRINAGGERNVRGCEQSAFRRIQMRLDSAAEAGRCYSKDNSIDVGQVDRIESDETSMIDVGDVQTSVDVSGQSRRHTAVGRTKFGLLMPRRERVTRCPNQR